MATMIITSAKNSRSLFSMGRNPSLKDDLRCCATDQCGLPAPAMSAANGPASRSHAPSHSSNASRVDPLFETKILISSPSMASNTWLASVADTSMSLPVAAAMTLAPACSTRLISSISIDLRKSGDGWFLCPAAALRETNISTA